MSYEEDRCMLYEEEDTCMSYQEEDTCTSYKEDTCMSYEEEDRCMLYAESVSKPKRDKRETRERQHVRDLLGKMNHDLESSPGSRPLIPTGGSAPQCFRARITSTCTSPTPPCLSLPLPSRSLLPRPPHLRTCSSTL